MDEVLIKRILPHSDEAEQSVIASMLMDKDAVVTAVDMLEKDDFYSTRYGILLKRWINCPRKVNRQTSYRFRTESVRTELRLRYREWNS